MGLAHEVAKVQPFSSEFITGYGLGSGVGGTLLLGAFTRRESYHKTLVVFGIAAFVLYIVLLFACLQ